MRKGKNEEREWRRRGVDRTKRNICFPGQDFLCKSLVIILEEFTRL